MDTISNQHIGNTQYLFIYLFKWCEYGLLSCSLVKMLGLAHGALNVQSLDVPPNFSWAMTPGSWQLSGCCTQAHLSSSRGQQPLPDTAPPSFGAWSWTSSTLTTMFSLWVSKEGNLPALFRPGPSIHGIYLIRDWSQRDIVLLGQLLDQFLILAEFLQHLNVHVGDIHSLGLITVLLAPQNTYGELEAGSGLKPDGAWEVFVLLRVTVLQADLKGNCLQNLPALALVPMQDFQHHLVEGVMGDFAAHGALCHDNRKRATLNI